jgi:hypothetical protein
MENVARIESTVPATAFGLSWVAYIRPVLFLLAMQLVSALFPNVIHYILATLAVAWFVYWVMDARALRIYANEEGVWVRSGILRWTRGISGVKWRDVDDATYYPNFISWAAKSYRICIGHRFTRSSEIFISHVRDGNRAVEMINGMHRQFIAGSDPAP